MRIIVLTLLSIVAVWPTADSLAEEGLINKLLAPGPLTEAHKALEGSKCLKCHTPSKGIPNSKCLDCHKEIQASILQKNTYHGRRKKDCYECHTDHKGREYNAIKFNAERFDHRETGYPLNGAHFKIECRECHTATRRDKTVNRTGTRWFGAERQCLACHRDDDVHFFKGKNQNKQCDTCHGLESFSKDVRFDHEKEARYRLEGKHSKLECKKCHVPKGKKSARYKWNGLRAKGCETCHRDVHAGTMTKKTGKGHCGDCHNQNTWKMKSFSHGTTGFPLSGKHAQLECEDCHNSKFKKGRIKRKRRKHVWTGLSSECKSCHEDIHGFGKVKSKRFGQLSKCQSCHNDRSFEEGVNFNHSYDTRFRIDGEHTEQKCFDCHKPRNKGRGKGRRRKQVVRKYQWPDLIEKTCETCHKNPHIGKFPAKLLKKKCTDCHTTEGWKKRLRGKGKGQGFSHDATDFPLTGAHKKQKCKTCHFRDGEEIYEFPAAEKRYCEACHVNVHEEQFSDRFAAKSCVECHTTSTFRKRKRFDHSKTNFEFTGKHKAIAGRCSSCHTKTTATLPTRPPRLARRFRFGEDPGKTCTACHRSPHGKQFDAKFNGMDCTECHTTETFKRRLKFDHDITRFALTGRHKPLKCSKCHKPTRKRLKSGVKGRKGSIARRFLFPDVSQKKCLSCHTDYHRGALGDRCSQCHTTSGWEATRDYHRAFTLRGTHSLLPCAECHTSGRRLSGASSDCHVCHQKDDIHQSALQDCGECHEQTFWEHAKFRHSMTLFPLRGAHRVLDCAVCHQGGIYAGRPSDCASCHAADRASVTTRDHSSALFDDCGECHNEFSFTLSGSSGTNIFSQ